MRLLKYKKRAVWPGDKAVMESKCGPATAAHAGKPGNADTYAGVYRTNAGDDTVPNLDRRTANANAGAD